MSIVGYRVECEFSEEIRVRSLFGIRHTSTPKMYVRQPFNADHNNGYSWINCNCCPYGYHIDLDFVRYCESISQEADRTGSIKLRRDRRRQRKSMEVLLGITPPVMAALEQNYNTIKEHESPRIRQQSDFEEAIFDFEQTLKRSKKHCTNLPDVTAVTAPPMFASGVGAASAPHSTSPVDGVSPETSPAALQTIRERMALSLERTKKLEDQVKLIPTLKAQVSALKEEKRQLILQIKNDEMNTINANFLPQAKPQPPPPPRRDFGVTCGVLTRNVGVGHQFPKTKSVSTATTNGDAPHFTDKWYAQKIKFLENDRKDAASQTASVASADRCTQSEETKPRVDHAGCTAKPRVRDVLSQTGVEVRNVGVHHDAPCERCSVAKVSVAAGPENAADSHVSPISLASLGQGPRSKSFNLGEDKLGVMLRKRTVGCQYETIANHVACQHEIRTHTRSCQNDVKSAHKGVQYESTSASKHTDTNGLGPVKVHVACEAAAVRKVTADVASNTAAFVPERLPSCIKCAKEKEEGLARKDGSPTASRIPRPQVPTTPVEVRKFRRQDTYTKIPASPTEKSPVSGIALSGLDFPLKPPTDESPEKVKHHKLQDAPTTSTQNGLTKSQPADTAQPVPELQFPAQKQRTKAVPSKEMQAAMKVVNDCLQKNQNKNIKNQLKNATNIIEQEWFKISSLVTANPLDVEDYLDAFEDVSFGLLEYIVNMTDANGNTAMHYAVSHGNFDVVSILLDSKVCDINKPNKAGYTCVMLVSLAEVRLDSHTSVVRRLFQMADVNVRAKQHGQTALMLAVSHGRLDMVTMLLEAGADINIQDEDGSTALMCAAEHGHVEIVRHFLSHPDCDSTKTDVDGSTALKIAMEAGHRHIGVLLYAHERSLNSKHKKSKSTSASPKTPSSPVPHRNTYRALPDSKLNK